MEADKEIFKSLIEPLFAQPVREASKKQRLIRTPLELVMRSRSLTFQRLLLATNTVSFISASSCCCQINIVHFLLIISNVIPLWNCLISSSSLRSPSHGCILQASMFASPEKPFLLPEYVEAMACALATSGSNSLPRPRYLGDPRVLNFLDLSAFEDFAFTLSSFDSDDERSPDSCQSSSESKFYSIDALVDLSSSSGCSSSIFRCSSDGSTSQSI
jgi:hypothetical protein